MEKIEMEKCAYCGKPGKEKEKFCSDECKRRYEKEKSSARMNVNAAMKKNSRKIREISDIFFQG